MRWSFNDFNRPYCAVSFLRKERGFSLHVFMIKTKRIITLFLVACTLFGITALFAGCTKRIEINFNDYVTIEERGYDGYGSIHIQIDYQTLVNQRAQALELTAEKKQELITIFEYYQPFKPIYEESDVLKNGDKIIEEELK